MVDNASSDQTVEELAPKFPQVKLIANKHNAGFSAANNQGVKSSSGEILLFLNPDAKLLDHNMQAALLAVQDKSDFITGPRILNPDQSVQDSIIKIPDAWDIIKEALFLTYLFKSDTKAVLEKQYFALSGACLLMNRSLFNTLNGFDENLFWMDDVDLCFRARKLGATVVYFDGWSVEHAIGVSSKRNYNKVISNQLISKLKFFKKNKMMANFFVSAIFMQLHIFLRIVIFLLLSPFNETSRKKLAAYLYSFSAFWSYIFTGSNRLF